MKYAAYKDYKSSQVEWTDSVPAHWNVKAARNGYSIQLGKMLQPESSSPIDVETPYLKSQHVQWESVRVNDLPFMWASPTDLRKYGVADGDLLVCEGGDVGRAGVLKNTPPGTIIQNALHRVRSRPQHNIRYLMYVLEHAAGQSWFEIICNRSTIAHFTVEKFAALRVPVPPLDEQQSIARFLDAKTAQIDELIAKKRQLIDKLKEKRQALIARTVTRGLPPEAARAAGLKPNPEMKDSGVRWFGTTPRHWRVVPYKRLCTRVDVGIAEAATHAYCDDGVPIIRSTNVKPSGIDTSDLLNIEPWFAEKNRSKRLRAGDLVTVRTGYPGTTAVVPNELDGCQCFTLVMSSLRPGVHAPFVIYFINSIGMQYFEVEGWGSAQANISVPIMQFLPVALPPVDEQQAIAAFLDRKTKELDALTRRSQEVIDRLTEYRQALITSAVTGKIDVRGLA